MKRLVTTLCTAGISAGIILSSVAGSLAAPILPSSLETSSNIVNVQHQRPPQHSNNKRPGPSYGQNKPRPPHQAQKPRPPQQAHKPRPPYNNAHKPRPPQQAHKPNRPGYWNGHNGYRNSRPGYRRHNDGWWYPMAAFALGAAIVGSTAPSQPAVNRSHVNWCANKYRSYRAYDNSYQPYQGPRAQCYSPYS